MAVEDEIQVLIKSIADVAGFNKIESKMKGMTKTARGTQNQLTEAGEIMRDKGFTNKQIQKGLNRFSNNYKEVGADLKRGTGFIKKNTGELMRGSQIANIASRNLDKLNNSNQKNIGSTKKFRQYMGRVTNSLKAQGVPLYKIRTGINQLGQNWQSTNWYMKDGSTILDKTTGKQVKMGQVSRKVARYGMRPFRGEFLSLMFIGMALNRTFGGMIKSVLRMTGIFDAFKGVLASILLPILMPLIAKWLPKLIEWLQKPGVSEVVGHFILFAAAVGAIMAPIFMVGLALSSLNLSFGSVVAWLATAKGGFGVLGSALLKIGGIFSVLWGVFSMFSGFLAGDWWKVVRGVLLTIGGIVALVFGGWVPAAILGVIILLTKLGDKFEGVRDVIMTAVALILTPLTTLYDTLKAILTLDFGALKNMGRGGLTSRMLGGVGIPGFQHGGIVTKPTLGVIGEAGPEAVVPLSGGGGVGTTINYNPTINVQSASTSGLDIDNLVNKINERLYDDLRRVGIR